MKIRLSIITLLLLISILVCSCSPNESIPTTTDPVATPTSAKLQESVDMGQDYIDSLIFIGESTTYHLKNRGVLSGGKNTTRVWGDESGTLNLTLSIDTQKIVYPETGEKLTFREAAARKKPKYVVLTFGLNGAVGNVRLGEEYYKSCYRKLIGEIKSGSPDTKVILQSAPPVAENMDMSRYSVTLKELNELIDTLNSWTLSLAEEDGHKYLATNEVLKDENGALKLEYQVGDGHHLTAEGYRQMLYYIRTHAYR